MYSRGYIKAKTPRRAEPSVHGSWCLEASDVNWWWWFRRWNTVKGLGWNAIFYEMTYRISIVARRSVRLLTFAKTHHEGQDQMTPCVRLVHKPL